MNYKARKTIISPVNCTYILDCSLAEDMNSTQRLEDDLKSLLAQKANLDSEFNDYIESIQIFNVKDHSEFILAKKKILSDGKEKIINPLLLIYGHGDKKKGLKLPSGEFINWDLLSSCLDEIVSLSLGELTVIGAFCHSYQIIEKYENRLTGKLPFSFYYGYSKEISFGEVEEDILNIVRSVILYGGEDFKIEKTCFSSYSEYDYIAPITSISIMLAKDPEQIHKLNDRLSGLISIRSLKEAFLSTSTFPVGEAKHAFNKVVRSFSLTEALILEYMHDTERRQFLLEDLKSHF
ncbi:TPA: hypothetical protein ACSP1O_003028 [Aeromonas veronii]